MSTTRTQAPQDVVITHPNRDTAAAKTTRLFVIGLLVASAVLVVVLTWGAWGRQTGALGMQLLFAILFEQASSRSPLASRSSPAFSRPLPSADGLTATAPATNPRRSHQMSLASSSWPTRSCNSSSSSSPCGRSRSNGKLNLKCRATSFEAPPRNAERTNLGAHHPRRRAFSLVERGTSHPSAQTHTMVFHAAVAKW